MRGRVARQNRINTRFLRLTTMNTRHATEELFSPPSHSARCISMTFCAPSCVCVRAVFYFYFSSLVGIEGRTSCLFNDSSPPRRIRRYYFDRAETRRAAFYRFPARFFSRPPAPFELPRLIMLREMTGGASAGLIARVNSLRSAGARGPAAVYSGLSL